MEGAVSMAISRRRTRRVHKRGSNPSWKYGFGAVVRRNPALRRSCGAGDLPVPVPPRRTKKKTCQTVSLAGRTKTKNTRQPKLAGFGALLFGAVATVRADQ